MTPPAGEVALRIRACRGRARPSPRAAHAVHLQQPETRRRRGAAPDAPAGLRQEGCRRGRRGGHAVVGSGQGQQRSCCGCCGAPLPSAAPAAPLRAPAPLSRGQAWPPHQHEPRGHEGRDEYGAGIERHPAGRQWRGAAAARRADGRARCPRARTRAAPPASRRCRRPQHLLTRRKVSTLPLNKSHMSQQFFTRVPHSSASACGVLGAEALRQGGRCGAAAAPARVRPPAGWQQGAGAEPCSRSCTLRAAGPASAWSRTGFSCGAGRVNPLNPCVDLVITRGFRSCQLSSAAGPMGMAAGRRPPCLRDALPHPPAGRGAARRASPVHPPAPSLGQ